MLKSILVPVAIFVSCSVLGYAIEKAILPFFAKLSRKSKIAHDDIILRSLKGMFMLWALLAGVYFALLYAFHGAPWMIYAIRVVVSLAIVSVTIILARIATDAVKNYSRKVEGVLPSTSIFSNLTKLIVFVIGSLVILQYLGISITPILTALGVGGLAVALALQTTLSNIFAGIQILMSRQIRLGDYIKLDSGEEGYVADISWRNTSIRMMSNSMILVPNSKLSSVTVVNHDLPDREVSVSVEAGISYTSDLESVERVVLEVASETMREVAGGVPDFKPAVRFNKFSDSSISFSATMRARSFGDQYMIRHEFIKRLHRRFNQEGIKIPFPITTVHLESKD